MKNEPFNPETPEPADSVLEARLTRALTRLPDVPVPTNFTSRLLQSVEREETTPFPRRVLGWNWHALLPRFAVAAAVILVASLSLHQHEVTARRSALARNVALVAGSQPVPSLEALKNFDVIQRMSQPRADEELLALMQ